MVSTTTEVPGDRSLTCGIASSELMSPGMLRSRTRTVGLYPRTLRSADSASAASATTVKFSSTSSSRRRPERTTWWSSATTIVIVSAARDGSA
jgi:hypothetical protein